MILGNNFKKLISLFAWVSVILFIIRLLISINEVVLFVSENQWLKLVYSFIGFAGEAIAVSGLLQIIYDKWLWKFRFFNFWKIPVLAKRYKGAFVSSYDGKERSAELSIKQSFLTIKVKMKTEESWSYSINETLEENNGVMVLTYTYLNEPDLKLLDRSRMHFGTATLVCDNVEELTGNYYTNRQTTGTMQFFANNRVS